MGAFRPAAVVQLQLGDGHAQPRGMHRHLRLDFEAAGNGREALGEAAREGAVAGEDVGEIVAEQRAEQRVEDTVAEGVALAAGIGMDAATRAHHHVGALGDQRAHQLGRIARRIGAVAVGHHVDVRLDIGEHAAHDIALALAALAHHRGAGKRGAQRRGIGGIVVVDIDARGRQRGAETGDDVADRLRLVVAGQQDGDVEVFQQGFRHGGAISRGPAAAAAGFTIS